MPDGPTTLNLGSILYRVHAVHLARLDGDLVLDALRAKVEAGTALDREEEVRLVPSCLMRHPTRTAGQAAHEAIDLAQTISARPKRLVLAAPRPFRASARPRRSSPATAGGKRRAAGRSPRRAHRLTLSGSPTLTRAVVGTRRAP